MAFTRSPPIGLVHQPPLRFQAEVVHVARQIVRERWTFPYGS